MWSVGKQTTANELAYTGGVYDKTTEEYYLNARYYDPMDGRFLTQDTYRGEETQANTWNLYSYCGGNPVNYVDPSGHFFGKSYVTQSKENYKYNKKHDYYGKYAYGQSYGVFRRMKFQNTTVKKMGCAAIAVYNVLRFYGYKERMSDVIRNVEIASGRKAGGATVFGIIHVLESYNFSYKHKDKIKTKNVNAEMKGRKEFILEYVTNKNGNHFIFSCEIGGKRKICNASTREREFKIVKNRNVKNIYGLKKVLQIIIIE